MQIESISDGATVHFKKKKRVDRPTVKQEVGCTAIRHDDTLAVIKQEVGCKAIRHDDTLAVVKQEVGCTAVMHDDALAVEVGCTAVMHDDALAVVKQEVGCTAVMHDDALAVVKQESDGLNAGILNARSGGNSRGGKSIRKREVSPG